MADLQPEVEPPSEGALRWVAQSIAPGARVTSVRRLTGGVTSAMHPITVVEANGHHHRCVLRRWVDRLADEGHELVPREARVLESLERTNVPAPRLLGLDPHGDECASPALLMSYLDGHVQLTPREPDDWVNQIASMLVRIHHTQIEAPVAESWLNRERLMVPEWSTDPDLWRERSP